MEVLTRKLYLYETRAFFSFPTTSQSFSRVSTKLSFPSPYLYHSRRNKLSFNTTHTQKTDFHKKKSSSFLIKIFFFSFYFTLQMYAITWQTNLISRIGDMDVFILLISCICHDLDHPGYNNIYQINAKTELALR